MRELMTIEESMGYLRADQYINLVTSLVANDIDPTDEVVEGHLHLLAEACEGEGMEILLT